MADKEKKIAVAKKLFTKHLDKVKSGKWTSREFRSEVITGIMSETGAPMNSAATMYQLVRSEAEAKGDLKGIELGRAKKASNKAKSKSANAKKSASKAAAKKTSKSKSANAKKSASKAAAKKTSKKASKPARSTSAVVSDPDGKWIVTNDTKTYTLSNRERARTAKSKLGEGYYIKSPTAAAQDAPAAEEATS